MSAVVGEYFIATRISDAGVVAVIENDTEVETFVVDKNKTRAGGAFLKYLNLASFDLATYGLFKQVDRNSYKHKCLLVALEEGGLSDVKLQQLVLTLRNRTIHKCDLSNVCNVLEVNVEIISLRNDNEKCRVEHYPMHPYVEYDET